MCVREGGGGDKLNISLLFAPFARLREFECRDRAAATVEEATSISAYIRHSK